MLSSVIVLSAAFSVVLFNELKSMFPSAAGNRGTSTRVPRASVVLDGAAYTETDYLTPLLAAMLPHGNCRSLLTMRLEAPRIHKFKTIFIAETLQPARGVYGTTVADVLSNLRESEVLDSRLNCAVCNSKCACIS